jgi:hypothetical protein
MPKAARRPGLRFDLREHNNQMLAAGLPAPRRPEVIERDIRGVRRVLRDPDNRPKRAEKLELARLYWELMRSLRGELRRIERAIERTAPCP